MSIKHYLIILLVVLFTSCGNDGYNTPNVASPVIYSTNVEILTDTTALLEMEECETEYHYGLNELYFQDNNMLIFGVRFVFFIKEPTLVDFSPTVSNAIKRLNMDFEPANIGFKAIETRLIEDQEAYNGMHYYQKFAFKYYERNTLNIFVFPNTAEPPISGAALGIPGTSMVIKSFFLDKSTISHEVGHLFGLYHTHKKDVSDTNNNDNGDYVCDTPNADQFSDHNRGFLGKVDAECFYTSQNELSVEENDILIHNLMSYSSVNCRCCITEVQIKRMRWIIENSLDLRSCLQLSL